MEQIFITIGIAVVFLFPVLAYVKQSDSCVVERTNLLWLLASNYNGHVHNDCVEFYFQNCSFRAFLANPIILGYQNGFPVVVPGFFAIECFVEPKNVRNFPLVITDADVPSDFSWAKKEVQIILDNGFNEFELKANLIQVRKLNIVLTLPNWNNLIQSLSVILPQMVQIKSLV